MAVFIVPCAARCSCSKKVEAPLILIGGLRIFKSHD